MTDSTRLATRTLAVECAAWCALVGVFLAQYVQHHLSGASAVLPHLVVVGAGVLALWSLRLLAWLLLSRPCAAAMGALLALPLLALAAYYALVLVGQQAWGRVVSWTLISTYVGDWQSLSKALRLPSAAAPVALLTLGGAAWWAAYVHVRRYWLQVAAQRRTRGFNAALVAAGPLLFALILYQFIAAPPVQAGEPLSLTFFPEQGDGQLQSHGLRVTETERARARADREGYRPGERHLRRNVVLVVVDALRADRLGVYGYARPTTPFLSAMKERGRLQRVERMSASCSESTCGLMAIGRSKYVHELSDDDFSLHEVLRLHDWKVHLVLGGDHTNFYGLSKAYGQVDSFIDGSMVPGYSMNDDRLVIDRLTQLPAWDGTPRLIQLHLMSSHLLGVRSGGSERFIPASPYVTMVHRGASAGRRDEASNHYDNGVLQMDAVVERALAVNRQEVVS